MENFNDSFSNNRSIKTDPEQLKMTVAIIRKCIMDLNNAKKRADEAWINYKNNVNDTMAATIDEKHIMVDDNYKKAIEKLEESANALDSVSNIWKDTEITLKHSTKDLEDFITSIGNTLLQNNNKDEH